MRYNPCNYFSKRDIAMQFIFKTRYQYSIKRLKLTLKYKSSLCNISYKLV